MSKETQAGSELSARLGVHWDALVAVATTRESCIAIEAIQDRVKELEQALIDARTKLKADGHDEALRIYWALNDIACVIN